MVVAAAAAVVRMGTAICERRRECGVSGHEPRVRTMEGVQTLFNFRRELLGGKIHWPGARERYELETAHQR